jgi:hypothetical protein
MKIDFSAFVPRVHFEQIAIKNLVSNQEYQRHLSLAHIQRLIDNFDLYQINPVKISRRDGLNIVMNGQHTIESVAGASGSRETPVWCMIYDDLEYTHEADIFANQQKYVKMLNAYEIFMAKIEAGDDAQIIIKSLVESYGLVLSRKKKSGGIAAINCIQQIYYRNNYQLLDRVIRLCVTMWQGEPYSLTSKMLNGIARLAETYGETLNDNVFCDAVGRFSAHEISKTAAELRNGPLGIAEAMILEYNRHAKDGLPQTMLYRRKAEEQNS